MRQKYLLLLSLSISSFYSPEITKQEVTKKPDEIPTPLPINEKKPSARASESSDEGIEGVAMEDKVSDASDRIDAESVASSGIDVKSKSDESNISPSTSEAEDRVTDLKPTERNAEAEVSKPTITSTVTSPLVSQSNFVISSAYSHEKSSVSVQNHIKEFETNMAAKVEKKSPPPTSPKQGTSFLLRDRLLQEKTKQAVMNDEKSEETKAVQMLDLVLNSPSLAHSRKGSSVSTPSDETITSPTLTQGTPTPIAATTPIATNKGVTSPTSITHEKLDNQSLHSSDSGSVLIGDSEPSILSNSTASMERPRSSAERRNSDEIEVRLVLSYRRLQI